MIDRVYESQIWSSDRWLQFIKSTAMGLNLNLTIILPENLKTQLHIPATCPRCHTTQVDLTPKDISVIAARPGNSPSIIFTEKEDVAIAIQMQSGSFVVSRQCICNPEYLPPLKGRATIAHKLMSSFHAALKESYDAGPRSIELLTLRQMNQIVLSIFTGDKNDASMRSFELILCSILIILEAQGSWLKLQDKIVIKGDTQAVETYLKTQEGTAFVIEVHNGNTHGQLGVLQPLDLKQASLLLPLMSQECAIVLEIKNLFMLLQNQISYIMGSLTSAVMMVNQYGDISYLNKAAEQLLGYTALELVGTPAKNIPAPWVSLLNASTQKRVNCLMDSFGEKDNLKWIDWEVSPLQQGENILGWIVLVNDRTDYHRWQEAARKAERLVTTSAMVSSLAHEIRNPLTAASGLLQLINRKNDPARSKGYIDLIMRELDRVTRLLNEFLLLGKPANIASEPLEPVSFLQELMPLLEGEAIGNEVEFQLNTEPVPPVAADPGQFTQVLLNLVRNAVEAIGFQGKIILSLRESNGKVCFSIQDSGNGLSPELMDHLFEPFFTTKERGTGLGLAVVQAIVHNHGGEIKAENYPEGGAIFSITLPTCPSLTKIAARVDVLIITKDETLRYPIEKTLRTVGFFVASCSTPKYDRKNLFDPVTILLDKQTLNDEDINYVQQIWSQKPVIFLEKPLNYTKLITQLSIVLKENNKSS